MANKIVPFIFWNKDCPACGGIKSIKFSDYYGQVVSNISQADGVYQARCLTCGREYAILWEIKDEVFLPSLADKEDSIKNFEKEFTNNQKRDIDDILFKL